MPGTLLGVVELAGSPASVSVARRFVKAKLGADHPALDDVTLLVSELVTNAVVHSDSKDGGRVMLAMADCYVCVHVDVVDAAGDSYPHVRTETSTESSAEGGRGLMLVERLACRWNVHDGQAGRTVWFEVAYARNRRDSEHAKGRMPV